MRPAASHLCGRRGASKLTFLGVGFALVAGASGGVQIRGVAPEDLSRYNSALEAAGTFACLAGGGRIPASAVNDDFCDCEDGSDEPGTSACAGKADAHFYCVNDGSVPKYIYASRVVDGICDCCDGSDEIGALHSSRGAKCPNVCESEGATFRAELERKRNAMRAGLKAQEELAKEAEVAVANWTQEKAALEALMPQVKKAKDEALAEWKKLEGEASHADKSKAQSAEETLQLQKEEIEDSGGYEVQVGGFLLEEDFESSKLADKWILAAGSRAEVVADPDREGGKVLSFSKCTWGGDVFSRTGFRCTPDEPCTVLFRAKGAIWQGVSAGTQRTVQDGVDAHSWFAVPDSNHDKQFNNRLLATKASKEQWGSYKLSFPAQDEFVLFGNEELRFSTADIHLMFQAHPTTQMCTETLVDDVRLWRDAYVKILDEDRDLVEFRLTFDGDLHAYSNGEWLTSIIHMKVEYATGKVHFGEYATKPRNKASLVQIKSLYKQYEARKAEKAKEAKSATQPEVSEYAKWALNMGEDEKKEASEEVTSQNQADAGSGSASGGTALDAAKAALTSADVALRDAETKLAELDRKLQYLEDGARWASLIGACVERRLVGYLYSVCFFETARQGSTKLGKFQGWAERHSAQQPSVMHFTGGDMCPGGPARTLNVKLSCGAVMELKTVTEPSRCVYEAEVDHPSACMQEGLDALMDASQVVKPLRPHEEL